MGAKECKPFKSVEDVIILGRLAEKTCHGKTASGMSFTTPSFYLTDMNTSVNLLDGSFTILEAGLSASEHSAKELQLLDRFLCLFFLFEVEVAEIF